MKTQTKASFVFALVVLCFFRDALSDNCNQRCPSKVDIVFAFDENCEPDEYESMRSFGKSFSQNFELGSEGARLGAVGYSSSSRELFPVYDNANSVQQGFDRWSHNNGRYSNLESGIRRGKDGFRPQRNSETEYLIIITRRNPNRCDNSNDPQNAALQEANSFKSRPNRKIIIIVVGSECDNNYYGRIASPGAIFYVPNFRSLGNVLSNLLDFICYRPPSLWVPPNTSASCGGSAPAQTGQARAFGYCRGCAPRLSYSDKLIDKTVSRYITRTWTAADNCGNTESGSQRIDLTDTIPPVLRVPSSKTVECNKNANYDWGTPTATDPNCPNSVVNITHYDQLVTADCPFYIQRIYSAFDTSGNQASGLQTLTLTDNKPPIITSYRDFCIKPDDSKKHCVKLEASDLINAYDECSDRVYIKFVEARSTCGSVSGNPPPPPPPPASSGSSGTTGTTTGYTRYTTGRRWRVRNLKSLDKEDISLRDIQDDDGKCEYDSRTDTLCIDAKPCWVNGQRKDRIYYVKLAVYDKCGNRKEQTVTVTVPADPNDPRCVNCVTPR